MATLQVSRMGRSKLAVLRRQAKTLGMSAEQYAKHLIEEGIFLEEQARTRSFAEILAPVRADFRKSGMTEDDLNKLVDECRRRHHIRTTAK